MWVKQIQVRSYNLWALGLRRHTPDPQTTFCGTHCHPVAKREIVKTWKNSQQCFGVLGSPKIWQFSSVQFSRSDVSDSLRSQELQHARLPCPLPTPGAYSNSCPLSQWYHPTISSSVTLSSFCSQAFPASRSFSISRLFSSDGQSIGASASVSIQGWFPSGLTRLISLQYKRLKSLLQHHNLKAQILSVLSLIYGTTLTSTHDDWKNHSFDYTDLCWQSNVSAFNTLSKFAIAFLARTKHILISWLQSPSAGDK